MTADPISASIMQKQLKSVTRQMAAALIRSSRSLNLSEARDFCTGIYGPDGGIWEQSEFIPIMSYTVPEAIRNIAEYFAGDLYPGDVIIHNDPFTGGNQTSDVKIIVPLFLQDNLLCFTAINAHQADVGGAAAGGYNPQAREIWQEALRITPLKLYEKGKLRRDVWDLVFANIRLPIVKEDIKPMVGACEAGCQELERIITAYGEDNFRDNLNYLFDSSELSMKEQLLRIPDGVYKAEQFAFGDGLDDNIKLRIALSLTVKAGRVCFDFSGTAAQTAGYVNAPYPVTVSGALFALLMCLKSVYPRNQGMMRCLDFIVPEGTLLNPRFPAATGFGNHLTDQIGAVVFKALYQIMPDRVTAGWNPLLCILLTGYDSTRERHFADMLINTSKGGSGATAFHDGWAHLGLIGGGGGITAQDPELFETENPVIFHRFELACDSAGVGKWRGGLGVASTVELIEDGITLNIFGDGTRPEAAAFGLAGGEPGGINTLEIIMPDGQIIKPASKDLIGPLPRGTVLRQLAGGGGGYGPPGQRAAELIEYDLRAGYVSQSEAARCYRYTGEGE
jgi:N-methylhydantoinase B